MRGAAAPQPPAATCPPTSKLRRATPPAPTLRLTDFDVSIYDPATQRMRSWLRTDGIPAVTLTDPLQAHVDMLRKWTDTDIHNMTAFLATLK